MLDGAGEGGCEMRGEAAGSLLRCHPLLKGGDGLLLGLQLLGSKASMLLLLLLLLLLRDGQAARRLRLQAGHGCGPRRRLPLRRLLQGVLQLAALLIQRLQQHLAGAQAVV